ncbi:MAG: hypothetical protein WC455_14665 [Dehalococcoidia bacterium]|jgi:hypothetical protein
MCRKIIIEIEILHPRASVDDVLKDTFADLFDTDYAYDKRIVPSVFYNDSLEELGKEMSPHAYTVHSPIEEPVDEQPRRLLDPGYVDSGDTGDDAGSGGDNSIEEEKDAEN